MKVYRAWVADTLDVNRSGIISVYCPDVDESRTFDVRYTSPYVVAGEGGMVAIPGIDTEIFIFKPDGKVAEDDWFYMSSVSRKYDSDTPALPEVSLGESVYTSQKLRPEAIVIKDPRGNQLTLSQKTSDEQSMTKAELKTAFGKSITMVDNVHNDKIVISNEHGDRFLLTSEGHGSRPSRSAQIKTYGRQQYVSTNAGVHTIAKGGEIDILNETGADSKAWPDWNEDKSVEENESMGAEKDYNDEQYGNINVKSKFRDINLIANEGRIFLDAHCSAIASSVNLPKETPGFIQIDSGKSITIWADTTINIKSGKDLNIMSGGAIRMQAKKQITMHSDENVLIDGAEIHLAPPGGINPKLNLEKETNHYGD